MVLQFVHQHAQALLGVDTAPAIAVLGGPEQHDSGIRFCGLPSGALFPVLLANLAALTKERTHDPSETLGLDPCGAPAAPVRRHGDDH